MAPIRPFGPIGWILNKLPQIGQWSVLGTIATEDRCLAAAQVVFQARRASDITLLKILDPVSPRIGFRREVESRLRKREVDANAEFGSTLSIHEMELLCVEQEIGDFTSDFLQRCGDSVIVDLSTMPKRFFFPVLTLLLQSSRIVNLLATYSLPERYAKVLEEDPDEWSSLPMYGGDPLIESRTNPVSLIIGVGYQPLKIIEILDHVRFAADNVKLLFPFPSIPPGFVENWKFVARIKSEWSKLRGVELPPDAVIRVPTRDASIAFDQLIAHTNEGRASSVVLAPFGPKPISLAMCLLGIARRAEGIATEIGYTQPHFYHPEYSSGVAHPEGVPAVTAYCVRLGGRNLFSLPVN